MWATCDLTTPPVFAREGGATWQTPGGLRRRRPAETRAAIRPFFDALGVKFLRIDVNEPTGIKVLWGWHDADFSRQEDQACWNYGGKGVDEQLAEVSLMMEALERRYASRLHHPELLRARWDEVAARAAPPGRFGVQTTAHLSGVQEWGWAVSMSTGEPTLLHANFLLTPYRPLFGPALFNAEFNGLAGGNTVEEAALHGLVELVERDAWVCFQHRRPPARRVSFEAVPEPAASEVLTRLARHGVETLLLYLGVTGTVHVFGALSFDAGMADAPVSPLVCGAHPNPRIAVTRCVTELVQARANQIFLRDEGPKPARLSESRALARAWLCAEELSIDGELDPLSLATPADESITSTLEDLLVALGHLGVEVFLTRVASAPDSFEVVKLNAAGLQPLTAGVRRLGAAPEAQLSRRWTRRLEVPG